MIKLLLFGTIGATEIIIIALVILLLLEGKNPRTYERIR